MQLVIWRCGAAHWVRVNSAVRGYDAAVQLVIWRCGAAHWVRVNSAVRGYDAAVQPGIWRCCAAHWVRVNSAVRGYGAAVQLVGFGRMNAGGFASGGRPPFSVRSSLVGDLNSQDINFTPIPDVHPFYAAAPRDWRQGRAATLVRSTEPGRRGSGAQNIP